MPKSLTRAPARLLVLAIAIGGPAALAAPAEASGGYVPTDPGQVTAALGQAPGSVLVDWQASVLEDSESPDPEPPMDAEVIARYDVVAFDDEGQEVEGTYRDVDASEPTEVLVEDLPVGTYSFAVRAVEADGDESGYAVAGTDVTVAYRLAPVSEIRASVTPGTVEISWTAPVVPTGRPALTTYDVFLLDDDGNTESYAEPDASDPTSTTFTDVRTGSYTIAIGATDAAGDRSSAQAFQRVSVVGHEAPDAPGGVSASQAYGQAGKLQVAWEPGEGDHGFTVESYDVRVLPAGGQEPSGGLLPTTVVTADPDTFDYDVTVPGIPVGTYDVSVTAVSDGQDATTVVRDVAVVQLPGKVQGLTMRQVAPGKVVVTWKAPAANGARVTGYDISAPDPGAQSGGPTELSATTFSRTFANIRPGRFPVRVEAVTPYGDYTQPGAPAVVTLNVTNDVKKGAPTLSVKDANLKTGQKLAISGTSAARANLQVELKAPGSRDFLVFAAMRANAKGAYSLTTTLPGAGTIRVVDDGTGRVSPSKAIAVTRRGR